MKLAHAISISVFSKPEEDEEKIKNTLLNLVSFDIEKEKIKLRSKSAAGFNERKIKILEISITKERHTKDLLDLLRTKLSKDQKDLLLTQKESRLDNNLNFFIRLDKEKLLNNEYFITDSGECFHIKISVAAYPAKRAAALSVINSFLEDES